MLWALFDLRVSEHVVFVIGTRLILWSVPQLRWQLDGMNGFLYPLWAEVQWALERGLPNAKIITQLHY